MLPKWVVLVFLAASGCGILSPPDTSGTAEAQRGAFYNEATAISASVQAQGTQVVGTAIAAETLVIEVNSLNQQLLATVRAGDPATRQVIVVNPTGQVGGGYGDFVSFPTAGVAAVGTPAVGDSQFINTVTTMTIRADDGCADGSETIFPLDVERIYVVTQAINLLAGTQMDVQWLYEGQPIESAAWVADRDESSLCVWFYIDSFSAGNWTVQLAANGTPISEPLAFTVESAA